MTLWGGRFEASPDEAVWEYTTSAADRRLLAVDIEGSIAHVAGLARCGILDAAEADQLTGGLEHIRSEADSGDFAFLDSDEDVHTAVERRLAELIGPIAGKLHTGRSRNDQIALDHRLYLRRAARARIAEILDLAGVLATRAADAGETVVPSYTHLQQAQAVPLAHHLLAHAWALLRDAARFGDALRRIEVSPLGAGAGGGSRLPIDPAAAAERLGLPAVFDNSLDAVAARDVETEYVLCCTQTLVHLSRLGEELVLWGTDEFSWASYDDTHTTGSSALPHKKNPDVAELTRAKAASAIGHLTGLLGVQKGLPLSYNRDLQQDKEHLFPVDDDAAMALRTMGGMIATAELSPPPPSDFVTALDLAEVLVERGVPFREAHRIVGSLVADVIARGATLASVTEEELTALHPVLQPEHLQVLDPAESVRARRSARGGSFASVQEQLEAIEARIAAIGEEFPRNT